MNPSLSILSSIQIVLQNARKSVLQAVNTTMVYTYFEIGRMILEHEQGGNNRAEYGMETLKFLSQELIKEFGKGFSVQNLDRMRVFYKTYSNFSTVSRNFEEQKKLPENTSNSSIPSITPQKNRESSSEFFFTLSWSHYVFLMRIKNKTIGILRSKNKNETLVELKKQLDKETV